MLINELHPVESASRDVSGAWRVAMAHAAADGMHCSPLLLSIGPVSSSIESPTIRNAVDLALAEAGNTSVKDNASTIFPQGLWLQRKHLGVDKFFEDYLTRIMPRVLKRANIKYGTYFGRMLRSTGQKPKGKRETINQVQFLLGQWAAGVGGNRRPRQSSLQLSIFDPVKDHTGQARRGFPCLQQVSLTVHRDMLSIHAFYPTQAVFARGYGNYLGLTHLGMFLGEQMQLKLSRVNVFVANPELGGISKSRARKLLADLGK